MAQVRHIGGGERELLRRYVVAELTVGAGIILRLALQPMSFVVQTGLA